jgi:glycine cleavage system aminomethyltransferase T
MAGTAEAGRITSAAVSPADNRPVALALLKSKHLQPGAVLSVPTSTGDIAATVFWPFPS